MKTIFAAVFLFSMLTGCDYETPQKAHSHEISIKKKCIEKILELMFDPDSYKPIEWQILTIPHSNYESTMKQYPDYQYRYWNELYIHKYRGKNKMGGYIPGYSYFLADSTGLIEMTDKSSLPAYINRDNVPEIR